MSDYGLSLTRLWTTVTRMRGAGKEKVIPKGGKSTKEEAEYFHKMFDDKNDSSERKESAPKMVDTFYDLGK